MTHQITKEDVYEALHPAVTIASSFRAGSGHNKRLIYNPTNGQFKLFYMKAGSCSETEILLQDIDSAVNAYNSI